MEVSRYLHFNCVRVRSLASSSYQGQWDYVLSYGWSSLPGYIRAANKVKYVSDDLILSLAGGYKGYQEFVWDGLRRGIENPFSKVHKRGSLRDQPAYREMIMNFLATAQVLSIFTHGYKAGGVKAALGLWSDSWDGGGINS